MDGHDGNSHKRCSECREGVDQCKSNGDTIDCEPLQ
jgi:hypothetical protein